MPLSSPLLPRHERAGAAIGEFFGCALPARFSSFDREYAFANQAVGLFDTNYQCWAWLDGADRVRYLNAITTNNIKDLAPGQGVTGLLLNPQGHILAEIACFALPDRLLLRSHAVVRQRTLETLEKFIIMDDATLTDASDQFGSVAVEGPLAPKFAQDIAGFALEGVAENAHAEKEIEDIACRVIRRSHFGQPGIEFVTSQESLPGLWDYLASMVRAVRGGRIGYEAINSLRLEAGVPWFSHDFDDKVIPHEAALEHSHINYTKGCYTGQEIVERVRSRGQVNRRLTALRFSSPDPPAPGTKLLASDKEVGHVTSAARSPRLQCPIGFAYLRREHASLGSRLTFDAGAADVVSLPLS